MKTHWIGCCIAAVLGTGLSSAPAADPQTEKELRELKERIDRLEKQPGAHKPSEAGTTRFFGYGEGHWNQPKTGTMTQRDPAQADFHRMVFGMGHEFADWVRLETEVEVEHAGTTIELEYAHLDLDMNDHFTFTSGALLMPVGMLNEYHEPTLFWSVERPYFEKSVIPTTWQELGFGVKSRFMEERLKYRAYLVAAVKAASFTGADGIRSGRGGGGRSTDASDPALAQRIEYSPELGIRDLQLDLGASHYWAPDASQDRRGGTFSQRQLQGVGVNLTELDARVQSKGFDLRTSWAFIDLSDAGDLNRTLATTATTTIGSEIQGYYSDLGYHLMPLLAPKSEQDLVLFVRHERFDTNHKVPHGFTKNFNRDVTIYTTGIAWFPVKDVALKMDVERWDDQAEDQLTRVNLGIAFIY